MTSMLKMDAVSQGLLCAATEELSQHALCSKGLSDPVLLFCVIYDRIGVFCSLHLLLTPEVSFACLHPRHRLKTPHGNGGKTPFCRQLILLRDQHDLWELLTWTLKGWFQQELRIPALFPVCRMTRGRATAWISVMCLKPLHPEKLSPGFRYRVWRNVLSETTSLAWSDMTIRFILLSFGFLMNKTNDRAEVQLWARAHACSHLTGGFSRLGFCKWGPCLWTLRRLYRWCRQVPMVINLVFLLKN